MKSLLIKLFVNVYNGWNGAVFNRHKDACDILTDVSTAFRLFSGTTPSRSSSPDSGSGGATSVVDRVSKQFQKECDSARKENDDLKKSMEDMGFKYGSSIQSTRKNSIGKSESCLWLPPRIGYYHISRLSKKN